MDGWLVERVCVSGRLKKKKEPEGVTCQGFSLEVSILRLKE